MTQSDTRVLTRNTYSLDLVGVLAHVRDTIVARRDRSVTTRATMQHELPRSRGGPYVRGVEDHGLPDSWRIR